MKLSARNVIKGTVAKVTPGAVNTEVHVTIAPGVEIVSVVTKESAEHLSLKVGSVAYVIIKASNVILGA